MLTPQAIERERRLKTLFDEIDDLLEEEFEGSYRLHPNRPIRGVTANKEADGLFNVGATFTSGYGRARGRGYLVTVRLATLEKVTKDDEKVVGERVVTLIEERLPRFFPGRDLVVSREGSSMTIYGDFSLGKV